MRDRGALLRQGISPFHEAKLQFMAKPIHALVQFMTEGQFIKKTTSTRNQIRWRFCNIFLLPSPGSITFSCRGKSNQKHGVVLFYKLFNKCINLIFILLLAVNVGLSMVRTLNNKNISVRCRAVIEKLLSHI